MFDGFGDVLGQAAALPDGPPLTVVGGAAGYADWFLITAVSGLAFLFLDRQFQVAVIENVDEAHLRTASWLLPGYLLAINLFVLPVGLGRRARRASARATSSCCSCRSRRGRGGWRWSPISAVCRRRRP